MQTQHPTRTALLLTIGLLTLGSTGAARSQNQTCIHRTADGRCLHWVPGPTNTGQPGNAGNAQWQYYPSPQSIQTAPSAPTSGCVYDGLNHSYRQCFHIDASGRCLHYGGRCN